ncbi:MAG: transposase [Gammaproteobacteria bacterium]|nr:transposase [Gammaproteobacteria bacterium]
MRSRKNQYTITSREVHDRAANLVRQHSGLQDHGYKCQTPLLLNILFFAASRICSVYAACRNLAHAPSQQTVFNALLTTLPEYNELEKRLNAALAHDLPRALRRRPQMLAIDLTLIPYHGQPQNDVNEIYRSQPKSGTSHFHAYATCYVVRKGHRFTIALTPVQKGEPMEDVVKRLLRVARAEGVKCRLLLLDRGFYSVAVIGYLKSARVAFLMPVIRRGRKPIGGKPATGTRAFARWKKSGWSTHTLKTSKATKYGKTAKVKICVSCGNFAGKWGRHGRRTFVYAFWGFHPGSTRWVRETYRTRFGIETSYRQMNEGRIRTCTRSPLLRLFFVGLAMILRNVWVWFHLTTLSERRGRRLVLHLQRLRFRDLLLNLQRVVESVLGITQVLSPQLATEQQLTSP